MSLFATARRIRPSRTGRLAIVQPVLPFDSWPDPYGPDPIVFGAEPRIKSAPDQISATDDEGAGS